MSEIIWAPHVFTPVETVMHSRPESGYTPCAMNVRTNRCFRLSALYIAGCLLACSSLSAQPQTPPNSHAASVLDSMPHTKEISEIAISPDGIQVAYIFNGELSLIPAIGGASRSITLPSKFQLRDVAWSADSKRLAFIADLPGEVPAAEVWTAAADGTNLLKHSALKGYAQSPRFSPDGSKLAILFIEGMPRVAGPLQPMTPLSGEVSEKIFEQRLATIDLTTDTLMQLTPNDIYVYEYDWTPDGHSWAASAAHGSGDANWYIARLYLVSAQIERCVRFINRR